MKSCLFVLYVYNETVRLLTNKTIKYMFAIYTRTPIFDLTQADTQAHVYTNM